VEALVISSAAGVLGDWTAHQSGVDVTLARVQVRRGETLDFVLSSRGNVNSDSFGWAPTIDAIEFPAAERGGDTRWDATGDFSGPVTAEAPHPLTGWEAYAQALLLTNEFLFID
jgi:hypothetical protein